MLRGDPVNLNLTWIREQMMPGATFTLVHDKNFVQAFLQLDSNSSDTEGEAWEPSDERWPGQWRLRGPTGRVMGILIGARSSLFGWHCPGETPPPLILDRRRIRFPPLPRVPEQPPG